MAAGMRRCPTCNAPNLKGRGDCYSCGASLAASAAAPPSVPSIQVGGALPAASSASTPASVSPGVPSPQGGAGQPPSNNLPAPPSCPACGGNSVRKVSSICREGTWTAQSQGVAVGVGQTSSGQAVTTFAPSSGVTSGSTHLAAALVSPPRPVATGGWSLLLLVSAGAGLLFVLYCVFGDPSFDGLPCWVFAGFIGLALVGFAWLGWCAVRYDRDILPRAVGRWEAGSLIWNRLYYCFTCDRVFDTQTGTHSTPEELRSRIFPGL